MPELRRRRIPRSKAPYNVAAGLPMSGHSPCPVQPPLIDTVGLIHHLAATVRQDGGTERHDVQARRWLRTARRWEDGTSRFDAICPICPFVLVPAPCAVRARAA